MVQSPRELGLFSAHSSESHFSKKNINHIQGRAEFQRFSLENGTYLGTIKNVETTSIDTIAVLQLLFNNSLLVLLLTFPMDNLSIYWARRGRSNSSYHISRLGTAQTKQQDEKVEMKLSCEIGSLNIRSCLRTSSLLKRMRDPRQLFSNFCLLFLCSDVFAELIFAREGKG